VSLNVCLGSGACPAVGSNAYAALLAAAVDSPAVANTTTAAGQANLLGTANGGCMRGL
jgi:hypothetical protein